MKTKFLAAAAAIALAVAAPSFANASIIGISDISDLGATDTIDWGQLSGSFTTPQSVLSDQGQAATVSSGGTIERRDQGFNWAGNFADGEHLLWTQSQGPDITIDFLAPISAVGAYIQSNAYGTFVGELIALDTNGVSLGSFALFGDSTNNPGTALFLGLKSTGADIAKVQFHLMESKGSVGDFAIGTVSLNGSAVPEPATWAMMISGFAMAGMALRSRRLVPVKA